MYGVDVRNPRTHGAMFFMAKAKCGFALTLVLLSGLTENAWATTLTGLVVVASDANGNDPGFGGGIWTTSTQNWYRLWVNDGDLGGSFVNGPDGEHANISIPMTNGIHRFSIQGAGAYDGVNHFAFNLFFNGQATSTQISAHAPLQQGAAVPAFIVNSSPLTSGVDFERMPAAGTPTFVDGSTTVMLTEFRWARPDVHGQDRVGTVSTSPDGALDFVGQFTLSVQAPEMPRGPRVNGVSVGGLTWTGGAHAIPDGDGSQLWSLPWNRINQFSGGAR
jgi:hypothetical protein